MPVKTQLPFRPHALAVALSFICATSQANTINVNPTCTLINAINNANSDTDTDGVAGCGIGSGEDIINLQSNTVYTLNNPDNYADNEGENGLPSITSTITINGNGATIQRASDVGTADFRLLHIARSGTLNIDKLTLTNGNIASYYFDGGAILNHGLLSISNSRITNSRAENGGGIANLDGKLTVTASEISNNQAVIGAGLLAEKGSVTLSNSSISSNRAIIAGGIMAKQSSVTINNSAIFNNKASNSGAISNQQATVTLSNSTVSGNKAEKNGGIFNQSSSFLRLANSTIANNLNGGIINQAGASISNTLIADNTGGDCANTGFVILKGNNLIADGSCNVILSGNPKLGLLLDNGGLTKTHALIGNLAVNKIPQSLCPTSDQRYVSRPQPSTSNCDIGAFERISVVPALVAATVQFFDNAVTDGSLKGVKIGFGGKQQTAALRNQLLSAGNYQAQNQPNLACSQLQRTTGYIDLDSAPDADDYVTGDEAATLAEKIAVLKTQWNCL